MTEQSNWKAFDAKLIARAWEDEAFKAALLDDPKRAIEQAGLTSPKNIEIRVIEETSGVEAKKKPGIHYVILPPKPETDEADELELSDEELEAVAGGGGPEDASTSHTYHNKKDCGCK